jgi:hypothetical protein
MCPLFLILFFVCWRSDRYKLALLFLVLNAAVREDTGLYLALPLILILLAEKAGITPINIADNPKRYSIGWSYCALTISLSALAFAIQWLCFGHFKILDCYYAGNPIQHLSPSLINERFLYHLLEVQYIWLPCLILIIGGLILHDARISAGGICFMPDWLFNFFCNIDLNAQLASYKTFPYILILLFPALFATGKNVRRRSYIILQILVLLASLFDCNGKNFDLFFHPMGIDQIKRNWTLNEPAVNREGYELFGSALRQSKTSLGRVRASMAVLSLYPYDFDIFSKSQLRENSAEDYDTLIWFEDDRDKLFVNAERAKNKFSYFYEIPGTRLFMLSRFNQHELEKFMVTCKANVLPLQLRQ